MGDMYFKTDFYIVGSKVNCTFDVVPVQTNTERLRLYPFLCRSFLPSFFDGSLAAQFGVPHLLTTHTLTRLTALRVRA